MKLELEIIDSLPTRAERIAGAIAMLVAMSALAVGLWLLSA